MRIGSPIARKKARIEIVPLIDVMFFLLASFMMVSLAMQRLRTVKMNLPSAVAAQQTKGKSKTIEVGVDATGRISVDRAPKDLSQLYDLVKERTASVPGSPIFITADPNNSHGRVIRILDTIKAAGGSQVSFALDTEGKESMQ